MLPIRIQQAVPESKFISCFSFVISFTTSFPESTYGHNAKKVYKRLHKQPLRQSPPAFLPSCPADSAHRANTLDARLDTFVHLNCEIISLGASLFNAELALTSALGTFPQKSGSLARLPRGFPLRLVPAFLRRHSSSLPPASKTDAPRSTLPRPQGFPRPRGRQAGGCVSGALMSSAYCQRNTISVNTEAVRMRDTAIRTMATVWRGLLSWFIAAHFGGGGAGNVAGTGFIGGGVAVGGAGTINGAGTDRA
jgi:hypothetical protein